MESERGVSKKGPGAAACLNAETILSIFPATAWTAGKTLLLTWDASGATRKRALAQMPANMGPLFRPPVRS